MKAEFERRQHRDILSTATRVGIGLIIATAWLTGAAQPEATFQDIGGPGIALPAPTNDPHSIFEAKPVQLLPAAPTPGNK